MVVDTTIFIEHLRSRDKQKTTLAGFSSNVILYVSTVTVFELFCGATDTVKYRDVQTILENLLILPVNAAIGEKAGEIFRNLRSKGLMIEVSDILIAATALVNNLPVKTLNVRHFSRIDGLSFM